MSSWLLFVIIGQFMFSVVVLTDRFIVTKKVVSSSIVYSFYVCLLSFFAIFAWPFGVTMPSISTMWYSLASSVCYLVSILMLYQSLKKARASEVTPVVGGVAAISTFLSSMFILHSSLPNNFIAAFFILVSGMLLISHFEFNLKAFLYLTGSGIFFGLSTVLVKAIFSNDTFINGFFWSRMANVLVAVALLLIPSVYKAILADWKKPGKGNKSMLVIGNKILSGIAFLCILVAINKGDVAIVNALSAAQYIFLFVFAIFFSRLMPDYFDEKIHRHELMHKSLATALIVIGFFVLFL